MDDESAARAVLGVPADADWATIRAAYRAEIRRVHPDVTGGTTSARSVEVNAAYRCLARHRTARSADRPDPARPPATPETPSRGSEWLVDGSTIVLATPPAESFRRLVEAAHALGDISYIDASAAIFETILALDEGIHASLVVSVDQLDDDMCRAWCTLEALERAESLDATAVTAALAGFLPPRHHR